MNKLNTYANLHSHDYYSVLDGHSSPKEILDRCRELGITSTATTNHGNEFSFYYYAKLQKDYPDIHIMYGVEFYECFNHLEQDNQYRYFHLLILAKNDNGIKAIHELITKSNFEGFYYKPRIDLEQLKPYAKDLIVTSACLGGKLGKFMDDYDKCIEFVQEYKDIFKENFYLEMQVHKSEDQIKYNKIIKRFARDTNTPYVITNDNHYISKKEQETHSYFVNINRDNADIENISEIYDDCYIHSVDEIYNIMSLSDLTEDEVTEGLQGTLNISEICNGSIQFGEPELPHIALPNGFKTEEEWFKYLIMQGWNKKIKPNIKDGMVYNKYSEPFPVQTYLDRIKEESDTIKNMNFIGYHLIVADLINWAKDNNIPVGRGRGSAVGAEINNLLNITDIDPIPTGLFFSRYLNKDRVTNPDIDSDFESCSRYKVIDYLKSKYGKDNVAQIINFTYISPKVAIKDAGRCLNKSRKDIEALAEFMTEDTVQESIKNSNTNTKLLNLIGLYGDVVALADGLNGRIRSLSIGSCGCVVTSKPIDSYCGMLKGDEGEQLLQVDKVICEDLGMVKMDLLGLKTLDILNDTCKKLGKSFYDLDNIPVDDEKTYDFLAKGKLCGVFQLESNNMTSFFKKLKPKNLEDICAGISLYRPGAMQYIDDYLKGKEDKNNINYLSPKQEKSLKTTYGCMVFQEQVMQILSDLAGFSFAQGDLVRRGMAKKKAEYVLGQRNNFIYGRAKLLDNDEEITYEEAKKNYDKNEYEIIMKGCIDNGIDEKDATQIFKEMEKFAEYAFNKSHGFSYGQLTYDTAYMKCHYPLEFMTSLLSHTIDNVKITQYLMECKELNIPLTSSDINLSEKAFTIHNNTLLYGIGSLRNVGVPTVEQIINNRPYTSFEHFLNVNVSNIKEGDIKINKSALISLINSGCFDNLPQNELDTTNSKRQALLMQIFFNVTPLIQSVSISQLPEVFDNKLIDINIFNKEDKLYELHKLLLKKKYLLDMYKDDEVIILIQTCYSNIIYKIDNDKMIIDKKEYKKEYDKLMKNIKQHFKDNEEEYAKVINKNRVIKNYLEYVNNRQESDLEFESTSFYFQDSWLNTSKEKYGIDEFNDIPNLDMKVVGYYKKKQLYVIVGVLIDKIKVHKEIVILTNNGVVVCKLGEKLYNTVASELSKGDKLALNGYVGNGFFYCEFYENGQSNKLQSLSVIND